MVARATRARSLMDKDGFNADDAAKVLGVSRRTMFRSLKAAREHDEPARAGALLSPSTASQRVRCYFGAAGECH